jgi:hypothetical protein
MTVIRSRLLPTIFVTLLTASAAVAGTLSGTVINRTTGKPEANIPLTLLSPTQGMRDLGSAKSDAQGRFTVTNDAIGTAPILVRATFHDVSFNTFAPVGRPEVEVEIFDISSNPKTITIPSHIVIFQPEGDKLVGAEEYTVDNSSRPPYAYFRTEGNFEFAIPENAKLGQISTSTSMGMPITQASIDHGKGRFAIAYPFRPGQTNVRLSYELPYSNNAATLKLPASYAGVKLLVVVPPGVNVTGDGLTSAGQEQGMMVYTHEPLAPKAALSVSVSGVGAPPSDAQGSADNAQEGNSRNGGQEVLAAPSRIDDMKWFLFAGLAALFAMGALLLSRKQVVVTESEEELAEAAPASKPAKQSKKKAVPVATGNSQNHASVVEQHATASLDSLKDEVFRLELRRQAGTISEEEYAREKARIDKLLRDLVKG